MLPLHVALHVLRGHSSGPASAGAEPDPDGVPCHGAVHRRRRRRPPPLTVGPPSPAPPGQDRSVAKGPSGRGSGDEVEHPADSERGRGVQISNSHGSPHGIWSGWRGPRGADRSGPRRARGGYRLFGCAAAAQRYAVDWPFRLAPMPRTAPAIRVPVLGSRISGRRIALAPIFPARVRAALISAERLVPSALPWCSSRELRRRRETPGPRPAGPRGSARVRGRRPGR
jgi:hypothetical protein